MCVDYRDLNRASPKDNFPLPHIDMLVDNTAQHAFYSFMDGFSRYNQIQIAQDDREKPPSLLLGEHFATRAMVALFHDMMHKEMKVYMDNMITKSKTPDQHVRDLRKLFERLRKYRLRLNLTKCTFGVKTRKLLGFIVNERGIKVDSDKVHLSTDRHMQPHLQTPPEKSEDGVESRVPGAFRKSYRILGITSYPCPGSTKKAPNTLPDNARRINGLCLGATRCLGEERIGHILSQQEIHRLGTKIPSTIVDPRSSLGSKEYMLAHTTWLIAKTDPLKYIFKKPALTGRIARWQMALSEYDIVYKSQKAIKGSTLAEQLAHYPLGEYQPLLHEFPDEYIMSVDEIGLKTESDKWRLWFDGASNLLGNGIGAILASPEG
ncbi:hypothetical protein CR513_24787, partial [Mucuna pruriens]